MAHNSTAINLNPSEKPVALSKDEVKERLKQWKERKAESPRELSAADVRIMQTAHQKGANANDICVVYGLAEPTVKKLLDGTYSFRVTLPPSAKVA